MMCRALDSVKEAQQAAGEGGDLRPLIAKGNILYGAGNFPEASKAYEVALQRRPGGCPAELYVRLGRSFLSNAQPEYAVDVFLQVRPPSGFKPSCGAALSTDVT